MEKHRTTTTPTRGKKPVGGFWNADSTQQTGTSTGYAHGQARNICFSLKGKGRHAVVLTRQVAKGREGQAKET